MQGKRERLGPGLLKVSLRADQTLKALIYFTAPLPVVACLSLPAIDASHDFILNSSLHHGAGAMAQAMAGQLDHTNDANNASDSMMANDVEVTVNWANCETASQALKRANAMAGRQYTAMRSAGHIAGSIPTITAGLRNVTHEFRFLNGLVNVTEVNIPVSATSTVTGEDLKATWSSS